jgi:hypothetical protein
MLQVASGSLVSRPGAHWSPPNARGAGAAQAKNYGMQHGGGRWHSSSAISRVQVIPNAAVNWAVGCRMIVYRYN